MPGALAPDPSIGALPDAVPEVETKGGPAPTETQAAPAPPTLPLTQPTPPEAEAPGPAAAAASPRRDVAVQAAGSDPTVVRSEVQPRNLQAAGKAAATVGDEVITLHQLKLAVSERLKGVPPGQTPSERELEMVAVSVLQEMIERSVIVQEAKRELKDPKQLQRFMGHADEIWREQELAPMLRQYSADNEYQLREKLKEQGRSLDELHETFRRHYLSQGYMKAKLDAKLSVSLPEMHEYYKEHLKDFDRPAQVTWREVVIDFDKCRNRAEARSKADAVLGRLRRGEDFATVAHAESHGPNKSKGGLWETSPGGYAVEAVNAALESLPLGQISQVVEGPTSYHVVRVEARRGAGPASFAEASVQDKVKRILYEQKARRETTAYIDKLRGRTLITTMFDGTPNDPSVVRTGSAP